MTTMVLRPATAREISVLFRQLVPDWRKGCPSSAIFRWQADDATTRIEQGHCIDYATGRFFTFTVLYDPADDSATLLATSDWCPIEPGRL